mmetsp:Transcript_27705/g.44320  ORF Transcript_27705/g.44320 Transcript_27705/m.44320 type:complete len:232 (+) Transcript_27705:308-1003(+)
MIVKRLFHQFTPRRAVVNARHSELIKRFTFVEDVSTLKLHLITPESELYHISDEALLPFSEPWWAFCWPGGTGLTQFLIETPEIVSGKRVLDIGAGAGSASIAALLGGASYVVANDVDKIAETAISLNTSLNLDSRMLHGSTERLYFLEDNVICEEGIDFLHSFDVVLCGDMLYDEDYAPMLLRLLKNHPCVLFGDPGRAYFPKSTQEHQLLKSYKYETDGFNSIKVFRLL